MQVDHDIVELTFAGRTEERYAASRATVLHGLNPPGQVHRHVSTQKVDRFIPRTLNDDLRIAPEYTLHPQPSTLTLTP